MSDTTPKPHPQSDRILRVIDYIHANADQGLSLDQLADVAALSRFHWHRVFTAVMGAPPAAIIRSVRLHKASMLLVRTDLPIPRVATLVGYPNDRSFARAFKDAYGKSPTQFRKAGQEARAPYPLKGVPAMYTVNIRTADPMRLAALAHAGDYANISIAFQKIGSLMPPGDWGKTRGMAGVYYDDPGTTPEAELRSHAGAIWVGDDIPPGLEGVKLAGGRYAVLTLKGPYSGLAPAYQYLYGPWLVETQENLRDAPSFEVYLNDPSNTAPDDLLTDVYMPLADD